MLNHQWVNKNSTLVKEQSTIGIIDGKTYRLQHIGNNKETATLQAKRLNSEGYTTLILRSYAEKRWGVWVLEKGDN